MAYDCQLADQGVKTALAMLNNQWEGRPLEYFAEDNALRPGRRLSTRPRKLVESDKIDVMIGPIFSPSGEVRGRTTWPSPRGSRRSPSWASRPRTWSTANGLAFIHTGIFDSHGYYFGKYLAEKGFKTANVINYDDTPAYALTAGFKKAFVDEGGGQILSENYVPLDMVDFSSYLTVDEARRRHGQLDLRQRRRAVRQAVSTTTGSRRRWPSRCRTTSATLSWPNWATCPWA